MLLRVDASRARDLVNAQKFAQGLALAEAAWTRAKAQLHDTPREAIDLLSSISLAAEMTGDLQRADAAYREAIAVAERLYVRPHPDTACGIRSPAIGVGRSVNANLERSFTYAEPRFPHPR